MRRWLFLILLTTCLALTLRLGERHDLQIDLSAQQRNSLSTSARQALDSLDGALTIEAFVPDYPVQRAQIERVLAPYLAHQARVQLQFVDPVAEPERTRSAGVARHGELHLRVGQRREVLAKASAAALDAALNRLALQGERWVVALKGQGEAVADDTPGGIGRFVAHVEALGYRFVALDPRQLDQLPQNTAVLLIGAPRERYSAHVEALIDAHVAAGGGLLWLLDDAATAFTGKRFGIDLLPGVVVDAAAAQYGFDRPDNAVITDYPALLAQAPEGFSAIHRARALRQVEHPQWREAGRLRNGARSWNETADISGELARDSAGEQAGPMLLGIALQAADGHGEARVVLVGGRHFLGNDYIGRGAGLALASGLLHWVSGNESLGGTPARHGLDVHWSPHLAALLAIGLMVGLPLAYLATGLWLRRGRRKA